MKRFLALLGALLSLALPLPAAADEAGGLAYTVSDGAATIYAYTGQSSALVIPACLDGLAVAAIEDLAFWGYDWLTSVYISPGVSRIGEGAFCECSALSWAVVPPTVEEIGPGTFQACYSLNRVVLPQSIRRLGAYAFNLCTSLTGMELPGSVQEIGRYAFNRCSRLQQVRVAEGTAVIGDCAFASCPALERIFLPASLENLGEDVFYGSSPLIVFAGTQAQWEQLAGEQADSLEVVCTGDSPQQLLAAAPGAPFQIEDGILAGIPIGWEGNYFSLGELAADLLIAPGASARILVPPSGVPQASAPTTTGTYVHVTGVDGGQTGATVIIMGDVCETGIMSIAQVVRLAQLLTAGVETGPAFLAGDWNGNGRLDISDLSAEADLLRG